MLQHLNSKYDAYIVDTYIREEGELTYKVLLLDKNFYEHNDKVCMCCKKDVVELLNDTRFEFHNCSIDSDSNLWLSVCQPPQPYRYDERKIVGISQQSKTLWEFFWDAIQSGVMFFMNGKRVPATNITFSMASDDIILTDSAGNTQLLWSTVTDRHQDSEVVISCSDDFYLRWVKYLQVDGERCPDNSIVAKVDLHKLPYQYEGTYSSFRFCDSELVYLVERYLLLRVHLHGVELGNWFMRKLNGINSTLFGFKKPHIKRSFSKIAFHVDAQVPNAKTIADLLLEDLNGSYDFFVNKPDLIECLKFLSLDSQTCNNSYYAEFFRGFFSQISDSRSVIKDHEYLNAELLQKEITALACRIFVYRLIMLRRISQSESLYLSEGILRMEVIS